MYRLISDLADARYALRRAMDEGKPLSDTVLCVLYELTAEALDMDKLIEEMADKDAELDDLHAENLRLREELEEARRDDHHTHSGAA